MRCEEVKDTIDFAERGTELQTDISGHIGNCPECGKYYRLSMRLADGAKIALVPGTDGSFMRKLGEYPAKRRVRRLEFAGLIGAAAAVAITFGLLFNPFLPAAPAAVETITVNYDFDALESVYQLTSAEYYGDEAESENESGEYDDLDYYYALAIY